MALTDVSGSGNSGSFTDIAGSSITWTSTDTHEDSFGGGFGTTTANSDDGGGAVSYTFNDGAGGGAHGVTIGVIGMDTSINEQADFVINGVDVNLATLIANDDAQIVPSTEWPASWSGQGEGTVDGTSGNLTGTGGSQDAVVISFNVPITSLTVSETLGGPNNLLIDLFQDSDADPCFTRDTMIDTDQGEVAVQDLTTGMMVRTRDNGFQPIRWIGMSPTRDRAVRIKAGAMGNTRDLVVSPRHRMVLDGWQLKMLFDHDHALVTALELVNDDTIVRDEMADVEYYHVMFDAHEVIYAEGAATESFHPDQPSMGSMDAAAREEIFALFPELRDGAKREEAAVNLSPVQAAYVGKNLDAFLDS